jgi:hypothetical protein
VYAQSETGSVAGIRAADLDYMQHVTVGRNAADTWSTFNGRIGDVFFDKKALSDTEREEPEVRVMSKFADVGGPSRGRQAPSSGDGMRPIVRHILAGTMLVPRGAHFVT